jgi:hypothetical protein
MKSLLFFSVLSLTSFAWSAQEWKTIAVSTNCKEKVSIQAKEGEKHILAEMNGKQIKLYPETDTAFKMDSARSIVYSNQQDDKLDNTKPYILYTHPSMVEANPPKIRVSTKENRDHCSLKLK